ncbi:MAG: hypothetical protein JRJ69_16985 [Deltaproteobacteria bacterium]|nr:hypothetical protein [Deltaproteobacteria bacterium]
MTAKHNTDNDIIFGDEATIVSYKLSDEAIDVFEPLSYKKEREREIFDLLGQLFDMIDRDYGKEGTSPVLLVDGQELPEDLSVILNRLLDAYEDLG